LRRNILKIVRCLHATLILSIILPYLFALGGTEEEFCRILYMKNFLILIPILFSDIVVHRCKNVVVYIVCSVLIMVGALSAVLGVEWMVSYFGGKADSNFVDLLLVGENLFFLFIFTVEGIAVIVSRFMVRANMPEEENEEILCKSVKESFLDKPTLNMVLFFGFLYVIAFLLRKNNLCNQAFFSGLCYLFLALWYTFVQGTERYLIINRRTANLPGKRLYRISGGAMAVFTLSLLIATIPAVLTLPLRQSFMPQAAIAEGGNTRNNQETTILQEDLTEGADAFWSQMGEPQGELPEWLNYLAVIIAICAAVIVIWSVAVVIRKVFVSFQDNYDENGDYVEALAEESGVTTWLSRNKPDPARNNDVRKRYRKMIRKHRKERPAVYESPMEIEANAGLSEDLEMQELHVLYERVRYRKQNNSDTRGEYHVEF